MERHKPIPIETDRGYAPNTYEDLVEEVGSLACDPNIDCSQSYCFQDRHHLIFDYHGALSDAEHLLRTHPDFIEGICRHIHQRIHATWDRSEPITDQFAVGYMEASPVHLSVTKRKLLKELQRRIGGE